MGVFLIFYFTTVVLLGVVSVLSNQFDQTNINPISADNPTDPNFTCPGNGFFPLSPTACSTTFYNCVGGIAYIYVMMRLIQCVKFTIHSNYV